MNLELDTLLLSKNALGDAGASALVAGLLSIGAPTSLSLADCRIGDEGGRALAEALRAGESLTELSLQNNQIGDAVCAVAPFCIIRFQLSVSKL